MPTSSRRPDHWWACLALFLATIIWAISFPFIKTVLQIQQGLAPEGGSWLLAALLVMMRFGLAGLVLLAWCGRTLRTTTRSELWQGCGLGVFGGLGLLLQVDGLAYTEASTSAFITQLYVILLPLWDVLWHRRRPSVWVWSSAGLVLIGMAILARFDWHTFRLGRGEFETVLSTLFFAGQILWLDRPRFAGNRVALFTLVMFGVTTLLFLPLVLATLPSFGTLPRVYSSGTACVLMLALTLGCTLFCYSMMNRWQPRVTPTEAGLIYAVEPLFASCYALFLPAWLSGLAGIHYANETLTPRLLVGGSLITLANVLIQWRAVQKG